MYRKLHIWYTYCLFIHTVNTTYLEAGPHRKTTIPSIRKDIFQQNNLSIQFPFLQSTCVKEALHSFLPSCIKHGMDSIKTKERVETAIKLSLCEFETSGLSSIPNKCLLGYYHDTDSLMNCLSQTEYSSEWWTSYSGNYQRLSTICSEYSLPYEKEQLLDVFLNITDQFDMLNSNWDNITSELLKDVLGKWDTEIKHTTNKFDDYITDFFKTSDEYTHNFHSNISGLYSNFSLQMINENDAIVSLFNERDAELIHDLNNLKSLVDSIVSDILDEDVLNQIKVVKQENLNNWQEINNISSEIVSLNAQSRDKLSSELDTYVNSSLLQLQYLNNEVQESYASNIRILHNFDEEFQNAISLSIKNELLPELHSLKTEIANEWTSVTSFLNEDMILWNNEITEQFSMVMVKLNSTADKIEQINETVDHFYGNIILISEQFGHMSSAIIMVFKMGFAIASKKITWVMLIVFYLLKRMCRCTIPISILSIAKNSFGKVINYMLIILAMYYGSKAGSLFIALII